MKFDWRKLYLAKRRKRWDTLLRKSEQWEMFCGLVGRSRAMEIKSLRKENGVASYSFNILHRIMKDPRKLDVLTWEASTISEMLKLFYPQEAMPKLHYSTPFFGAIRKTV